MSETESKSLLFNGIQWHVSRMGETVILMECASTTAIEVIHQSSHAITTILGEDLQDIVPAYHSIAVFTPRSVSEFDNLLSHARIETNASSDEAKVVQLPICYEAGLDLDRLAKHVQMSQEELIATHLSSVYRSLFIGFTPGFIYADGLDEKLSCPRLENPRTRIPSGSVGIAGQQTGIYSLASPGGWNIIGRTPVKVFNISRPKPMMIDVGMKYQFYRITLEEFDSWEN